jgi:hypothetical protein
MCRHALRAAACGFYVFPLPPRKKKPPLVKDFPNVATRDPRQIRAWWKRWPDANIGISTSRFADGGALVVVDIDPRNGGADTRAFIDLAHGLPSTFTVGTPSGGQHLYYASAEPMRQGAGVLGQGVDIRSRGGYVVGPGSRIGSAAYRIDGNAPSTPVPAPGWLIDRLAALDATQPKAAPLTGEPDADWARSSAIEFLDKSPVAVQGERNQKAYVAAARLRDFGVDESEAAALMFEHWKSDPPLPDRELSAAVANAYRYGQNAPGAANPATAFDILPEPDGVGIAERPQTPVISATPYTWPDPAAIPPRRFLYARHYIRQFVSATIAPGGTGKTVLAISEALAMVTGRNLLGSDVPAPLRVWLFNLEDPREEMYRRIAAACYHYGIKPEDIGDRLFLDSGREQGICIAKSYRGDAKIAKPIVDAVSQTISDNKIDVLILDPFVETHQVSENDNGAINRVARQWQYIADRCNCAIDLVHHARKPIAGVSGETTVDDARGASALISAVRSARVLNVMTQAECETAGVENRRRYFRLDNGKANLAPPADASTWFRFASVLLPNGDDVAVVEPWQWPDISAELEPEQIRAVQKRISEGEWREDVRAKQWAGHAVADVLGLDLSDKAARADIRKLLRTWLRDGLLKVVRRQDVHREVRAFIEVGRWANV